MTKELENIEAYIACQAYHGAGDAFEIDVVSVEGGDGEVYTLTLGDLKSVVALAKLQSERDAKLLRQTACGIFFPLTHTAEMIAGHEAQKLWNPLVFEVLNSLTDDGILEKISEFHWSSTPQAMALHEEFKDLSREEQQRGVNMLKSNAT